MTIENHDDIEGKGFTIKDNRSANTDDGDLELEQEQATSPTPDQQPEQKISDVELDFSTFVLSLTSSAFYHLGDIPNPKTGETKIELGAVKQTIDILVMLKEKTTGNLSSDESKLIEQLIYELQIKYIAHQKDSPAK